MNTPTIVATGFNFSDLIGKSQEQLKALYEEAQRQWESTRDIRYLEIMRAVEAEQPAWYDFVREARGQLTPKPLMSIDPIRQALDGLGTVGRLLG